ncbi:hypothetical protein, partial [Pontibacterium sp.]|uniref:hypothetical protein n=1 Tax=Pontibacterium sp. TaxID=2036026 RepID=UPI00356337D0
KDDLLCGWNYNYCLATLASSALVGSDSSIVCSVLAEAAPISDLVFDWIGMELWLESLANLPSS